MADTSHISGTISVAAAGTVVTGVGSTWNTAKIQAGDIFWARGLSVRILSVQSSTQLTLAYPWPGATLAAGSAYEIRIVDDAVRMGARLNDVLNGIGLVEGNVSDAQAAATAAQGYASDLATAVTSADEDAAAALASKTAAQTAATQTNAAAVLIAGGPVSSIMVGGVAKVGAVVLDPLDATSVRPVLHWDLTDINGAPFRGNFVRNTGGGLRQRSSGLLVPTGVNEPVVDFKAGTALGTGFYGAYTNLLLRSEEFDTPIWSKQRVTVDFNAAVAPDGTLSADKIVESVTVGPSYIAQSFTAAASIYTWGIFVKAAVKTFVDIYLTDSGAGIYARMQVNLATGTLSQISGTGSILALPNGWYYITGTTASAMPVGASTFRVQLGGTELDDGISGLYLWGAQLTQTSFPAPYVPTTSAAVTRNADNMTISGADFTDFYNPNEWCAFLRVNLPAPSTQHILLEIGDGGFNNRFLVTRLTDGRVQLRVDAGGVLQASLNSTASYGAGEVRVALTAATNNFALSVNGSVALIDTDGAMPTGINRLRNFTASGLNLNGHLAELAYFDRALDATTPQRMTA